MENIKNVSKTYHHDFDEYFSRNVIDATRENPKQRIALLAENLENSENKEKIRELLLCERECCKVASLEGGNKSNQDIIKECLLSNDKDSRRNAVKLIRHMLNDGDTEIKDMVVNMRLMSNLSWLLGEVVRKGSFETKVKDIIKIMFSDKNIIDAELKNEIFVANLLSLLGEMATKESLKDEVNGIIENIFQGKY